MILTEAREMAEELIHKHLIKGWRFSWNNRKKSFGLCDYMKRTISLSRFLTEVTSKEEVRDTVLHEIAHALTPGCRHRWEWREEAVRLGAVPRATGRCDKIDPLELQPKWVVVFGRKVVKTYFRKPSKNFSTCYLHGRKKETMGKLRIMPYEEYKRTGEER